jgi:hypothetical protein
LILSNRGEVMVIAFDLIVTLLQFVACVYFAWCVWAGYRRTRSLLLVIFTACMVVLGVVLIHHDL